MHPSIRNRGAAQMNPRNVPDPTKEHSGSHKTAHSWDQGEVCQKHSFISSKSVEASKLKASKLCQHNLLDHGLFFDNAPAGKQHAAVWRKAPLCSPVQGPLWLLSKGCSCALASNGETHRFSSPTVHSIQATLDLVLPTTVCQ